MLTLCIKYNSYKHLHVLALDSFTRVFCSELLALTLHFLQLVSQNLVLTWHSDHNNSSVRVIIQLRDQRQKCMQSKSDRLYLCSQDCSDFFIWAWEKLSSHCKLFTSCKWWKIYLQFLITFQIYSLIAYISYTFWYYDVVSVCYSKHINSVVSLTRFHACFDNLKIPSECNSHLTNMEILTNVGLLVHCWKKEHFRCQ